MDNSLYLAHQTISVEALNPMSHMRALAQRFPDFVSSVKTFIVSEKNNWSSSLTILNYKAIEKPLHGKNYVEVMGENVFIPPGLNCTYLDYLAALEGGNKVIGDLIEKTLKPYANWLAIAVSQPETLQTVRTNSINAKGVITHDLDKVNADIAKCFGNDDASDRSTFGKVYQSMKEVKLVNDKMNDLTQGLIVVSRKEMVKVINDILELLDTLTKRVKEDPETYKASTNVVKMLSDMTYSMALEVEFFSTYSYYVLTLNKALVDTYDQFK